MRKMDMNYRLDQIDILEQMQRALWEQQMMQMQQHQQQHPPPISSSVPTEIEIMSTTTSTSSSSDDQPYQTNTTTTTNDRPSVPSVECNNGYVTYRSAHRPHHHHQYDMSFTTEALTTATAGDAQDYYFYKDDAVNDNDYDNRDGDERMTTLDHDQYYRPTSREEEYTEIDGEHAPPSLYPLLMDGSIDYDEDDGAELSEEALSHGDGTRARMASTTATPTHQQHNPSAEEEHRLVIIPQRRNALEPEEYAYPREFTTITTLTKPSAFDPQQSHSSSNSRRRSSSSSNSNGGMSSRRGSRSINNHSHQLTTVQLSSIIEQPDRGVVTSAVAMTNNMKPSSTSSCHERYNGYQHNFVTVLTEHRFLMLYTFLSRREHHRHHSSSTKIVVLFSTIESLMYYTTLLRRLKFNVRALHEGMKREAIKETLQEFSRTTGLSQDDDVDDEEYSSTLILCMLDFQGKDNHIPIPSTTNWIVQFEPCTNPSEYIYQVGRISHDTVATRSRNRRASYNSSLSSNIGRGTLPPSSPPPRALLFLTPNEYGFHKYYKAAQVKTYEYEIPHLCNVQSRLIKLLRCDENKELRKLGLRACRAYLFAYARHEFGDIYDVNELNVEKVALSFGFDSLPSEELLESIRNGGDNDAALGFLFDEKVRTKSTNTNSNGSSSLRRKTAKASSSTWMTGEKTWKHADRHADTIRVNNPTIGAMKPKLVVTR